MTSTEDNESIDSSGTNASSSGTKRVGEFYSLEQAMSDSIILARFASRDGAALPDGVLEKIVSSKHLFYSNGLSAEQEAEFLVAFQKLSKILRPVTVTSIRSTEEPTKFWPYWPNAHRSVVLYAAATIAILIVVIGLQIYWVAGKGLADDIQAAQAKLSELQKAEKANEEQQQRLDGERQLLRDAIASLNDEIAKINDDSPNKAKMLEERKLKLDALDAVIEDLRRTANNSITGPETINGLKNYINANLNSLITWQNIFSFRKLSPDIEKSIKSDSKTTTNPVNHTAKENIGRNINYGSIEELVSAQIILGSMSSYVLPMFYGLLGALAFTLRSLAIEIANVTFSNESKIRYRLRWPLGMLAGIAVLWFLPGTSQTAPTDVNQLSQINLSQLQPLALAFLAGYGVELFFNALERLFAGVGEAQHKKEEK